MEHCLELESDLKEYKRMYHGVCEQSRKLEKETLSLTTNESADLKDCETLDSKNSEDQKKCDEFEQCKNLSQELTKGKLIAKGVLLF